MTTFLSDIVLAGANDIQFKNTSGANTGKIESDGDDLVLSNAVGDILLGDGSSDVYIGDGTNSVNILFEVSGAISAESGAALTLGGEGGTLALGGAISLADYVSAISATGVNTVDVGTSAKPFKNIYAAHHVGGRSINYATSRGWVEDAAPGGTQVGEFGGNFTINGIGDENAVVWGDDPFNNKALLWKCILNTSENDGDGGWNKNIVIPANNNIGYLSYVYFKTDFTPDNANDGTVYLGGGQVAGQTLNLDGSNNTNPYSTSSALNATNNGGALTANRWYIAVGIYQAYNNSTTDNDTISGVYDVETGEKVATSGEFKMGNNTTGQVHRAYMYYDASTDANENVYFWNPGFHAIDGSEPKIQDLVKRQVYLDDNVKAAFGTGNDLEIYHDATNSTITNATGDLKLTCTGDDVIIQAADDVDILVQGGEVSAKFGGNGGVDLYHNNVSKFSTTSAGIEVVGEVQGDTLNIDGAADISGNLTGVDAFTASGKIQGAELEGTSLDINGDAAITGTMLLNSTDSNSNTFISSLASGGNSKMLIKGANYNHDVIFETSKSDFQYAKLNASYNGNDSSLFLYKSNSDTTSTAATTTISTGTSTFAGNVTAGSNSLTAGSLDINGNADISGNLTGLDNVTSTNFIIGGHTIDDVDVAGEFVDSAAHLLTSAAALDKFHVLNADTTGNADTATLSSTTTVTDHSTNNIDYPVVWHNNANALYDTASKFTFNPSTGALTTTTLSATNYGLASGDIPNNAADTTGNADTATLAADATTLATPRAINGVNFDGSAAITVTAAAGTLSGDTLKSSVVTSSLTSVGTIGTGTWQGARVASLYLDADTAHLTTDQTFTGVKTFEETIVGSVNGSAATVTSGSQANITTLAGVTSIGTAGATTNVLAGDLTMYNPVNGGNPTISIGSSATERLEIQAGYESGAQGLDIVRFTTFTAGSGSNDGRYAFEVDDVFLFNILDDGIRIKSSGKLEIGSGNAILSDSSGTTTLSNIDALDATTQNTISATTRQLTHHTIQDDIDTQVVFLSLTDFDSENTTIGNNKLPLIAPVAGKLLKVFVRCSHNLSGVDFTWKLYTRTSSQSTSGNAAEIGAQTGTGPTNGNMVTYDFTTGLDSGTNAIGAGDKVQLSMETNGATSNANFFITLMWEWDLS